MPQQTRFNHHSSLPYKLLRKIFHFLLFQFNLMSSLFVVVVAVAVIVVVVVVVAVAVIVVVVALRRLCLQTTLIVLNSKPCH